LVNEDGGENKMLMTFELAQILYRNPNISATEAFLNSKPGRIALSRLGIPYSEISEFYSKSINKIPLSSLSIKISPKNDLEDFASAILALDKDLVLFLSSRGTTKDDFIGAFSWTQYIFWRFFRPSFGRLRLESDHPKT
jgi:hypothetical protein